MCSANMWQVGYVFWLTGKLIDCEPLPFPTNMSRCQCASATAHSVCDVVRLCMHPQVTVTSFGMAASASQHNM